MGLGTRVPPEDCGRPQGLDKLAAVTLRALPAPGTELRTWLDATCEFIRAVNQGLPKHDLYNLIAGTVAQLTGYDFCAVLLPDEEGEKLLIRGFYGLSPSYAAEVNAAQPPLIRPGAQAEGPSSRAFRTQRPVVLVDIRADATCLQWEGVAAEQGYRSILSVPLVASEGSLGVLNCYIRQPREWADHEVVLMETVANQAALAIESSLLRERERARVTGLEQRITALEEEHRITRRGEDVYRGLMRLLLAGESLDRITRALAGFLKSDVLIEDPADIRWAPPWPPRTSIASPARPPARTPGSRRSSSGPGPSTGPSRWAATTVPRPAWWPPWSSTTSSPGGCGPSTRARLRGLRTAGAGTGRPGGGPGGVEAAHGPGGRVAAVTGVPRRPPGRRRPGRPRLDPGPGRPVRSGVERPPYPRRGPARSERRR